ncbi:NXPE family member 2-like [Branchiostoma floridae]|uniref:NXPE family member 2-like n=1 Tax=Branchiostoma floridae TaxID=7739 RepID=A0A9J7LSU5_BRAFL|nr:NXPE family member 2-like [Branchiostoma floridae]
MEKFKLWLVVFLCLACLVSIFYQGKLNSVTNERNYQPLLKAQSKDISPETPLPHTPTLLKTIPALHAGNNKREGVLISQWRHKNGSVDFSLVTQSFVISVVNPQPVYQVGQQLLIKIVARDSKGRAKSYGGDFLRTKLYSTAPVKASTTGRVTDFQNGTYIASFVLSWPGKLSVSVQLIHSSEAVQVLKRIRDTEQTRRIMVCSFLDENKNISEWTPCTNNVEKSNSFHDVCDFSKPAINASFYCERPRPPSRCGSIKGCHRDSKGTSAVQDEMLTADEKKLFPVRDISFEETPTSSIKIRATGRRLTNKVAEKTLPLCAPRLPETASEGYWFNGTWYSLRCRARRFPATQFMLNCLQNKSLFFFGDSTTRQWWAFLKQFMNLRHEGDIFYGATSVSKEHNMKLKFAFHNFPRNLNSAQKMIEVDKINYVADNIDDIVGGPNVVIVVGLWAHYTAEHIETFRARVWGIRHAIERLHSRSPETMVVWRTSNTNNHVDLSHFVENSDWYAYQLLLEVKEILKDLNVVILDVWDMSESMWHDANMHPPQDVIENHVNMLLSYICPS